MSASSAQISTATQLLSAVAKGQATTFAQDTFSEEVALSVIAGYSGPVDSPNAPPPANLIRDVMLAAAREQFTVVFNGGVSIAPFVALQEGQFATAGSTRQLGSHAVQYNAVWLNLLGTTLKRLTQAATTGLTFNQTS